MTYSPPMLGQIGTFGGVPVVESEHLRGLVVARDPIQDGKQVIFAQAGLLQRMFFLAEIREIVRDGILAAHPWIEGV